MDATAQQTLLQQLQQQCKAQLELLQEQQTNVMKTQQALDARSRALQNKETDANRREASIKEKETQLQAKIEQQEAAAKALAEREQQLAAREKAISEQSAAVEAVQKELAEQYQVFLAVHKELKERLKAARKEASGLQRRSQAEGRHNAPAHPHGQHHQQLIQQHYNPPPNQYPQHPTGPQPYAPYPPLWPRTAPQQFPPRVLPHNPQSVQATHMSNFPPGHPPSFNPGHAPSMPLPRPPAVPPPQPPNIPPLDPPHMPLPGTYHSTTAHNGGQATDLANPGLQPNLPQEHTEPQSQSLNTDLPAAAVMPLVHMHAQHMPAMQAHPGTATASVATGPIPATADINTPATANTVGVLSGVYSIGTMGVANMHPTTAIPPNPVGTRAQELESHNNTSTTAQQLPQVHSDTASHLDTSAALQPPPPLQEPPPSSLSTTLQVPAPPQVLAPASVPSSLHLPLAPKAALTASVPGALQPPLDISLPAEHHEAVLHPPQVSMDTTRSTDRPSMPGQQFAQPTQPALATSLAQHMPLSAAQPVSVSTAAELQQPSGASLPHLPTASTAASAHQQPVLHGADVDMRSHQQHLARPVSGATATAVAEQKLHPAVGLNTPPSAGPSDQAAIPGLSAEALDTVHGSHQQATTLPGSVQVGIKQQGDFLPSTTPSGTSVPGTITLQPTVAAAGEGPVHPPDQQTGQPTAVFHEPATYPHLTAEQHPLQQAAPNAHGLATADRTVAPETEPALQPLAVQDDGERHKRQRWDQPSAPPNQSINPTVHEVPQQVTYEHPTVGDGFPYQDLDGSHAPQGEGYYGQYGVYEMQGEGYYEDPQMGYQSFAAHAAPTEGYAHPYNQPRPMYSAVQGSAYTQQGWQQAGGYSNNPYNDHRPGRTWDHSLHDFRQHWEDVNHGKPRAVVTDDGYLDRYGDNDIDSQEQDSDSSEEEDKGLTKAEAAKLRHNRDSGSGPGNKAVKSFKDKYPFAKQLTKRELKALNLYHQNPKLTFREAAQRISKPLGQQAVTRIQGLLEQYCPPRFMAPQQPFKGRQHQPPRRMHNGHHMHAYEHDRRQPHHTQQTSRHHDQESRQPPSNQEQPHPKPDSQSAPPKPKPPPRSEQQNPKPPRASPPKQPAASRVAAMLVQGAVPQGNAPVQGATTGVAGSHKFHPGPGLKRRKLGAGRAQSNDYDEDEGVGLDDIVQLIKRDRGVEEGTGSGAEEQLQG